MCLEMNSTEYQKRLCHIFHDEIRTYSQHVLHTGCLTKKYKGLIDHELKQRLLFNYTFFCFDVGTKHSNLEHETKIPQIGHELNEIH